MAATKNAVGGKGPGDDRAGKEGKREGMVGQKTRPNHPDGGKPVDKVRGLQRRLWAAAKRQPGRRFHALYDRICRSDVLAVAWKRVKRNQGAAGVDRQTIAEVEQMGVERFLQELGDDLRAGRYRPKAVLRRYIPKADGRRRPLGIPTVRDRVAQMAAKLVLEPVFEADFRPSSYGFRPRRSATQALEALREQDRRGGNHVLDADIRDYFESIDHSRLMKLVERRVSDRPKGRVRAILAWLKLELHPEKTRRVDLSGGKQGFDFLGCHLHKRMSGKISEAKRKRVYYLHRWPSAKSMRRVRTRVKELTGIGRNGVKDVRVLIRDLNPVLRGWASSFRTGNASKKFVQLDRYVCQRLHGFMVTRTGRNLHAGRASAWTDDFFWNHGLQRLRGTIQYPEAA